MPRGRERNVYRWDYLISKDQGKRGSHLERGQYALVRPWLAVFIYIYTVINSIIQHTQTDSKRL